MPAKIMKVGDPVIYYHGFSNPSLLTGEVLGITLVENSVGDGPSVPAVLWDSLQGRDVMVDIKPDHTTSKNNHWAYGFQLIRPEFGSI
jgi:hypothetical protein